jgi:hypothetical protein
VPVDNLVEEAARPKSYPGLGSPSKPQTSQHDDLNHKLMRSSTGAMISSTFNEIAVPVDKFIEFV